MKTIKSSEILLDYIYLAELTRMYCVQNVDCISSIKVYLKKSFLGQIIIEKINMLRMQELLLQQKKKTISNTPSFEPCVFWYKWDCNIEVNLKRKMCRILLVITLITSSGWLHLMRSFWIDCRDKVSGVCPLTIYP